MKRLMKLSSVNQLFAILRKNKKNNNLNIETSFDRKFQKKKFTSDNQSLERFTKEERKELENDKDLPPISFHTHKSFENFLKGFMLTIAKMGTVFIFLYTSYCLFRLNARSTGKHGTENLNEWLETIESSKKFKNIQSEKNIKTRFRHVAGLDEAVLEINEFVDFLKNPEKYKKIGARIPRGALLSGPPGTGKTLLARACAGESKVPFFYCSGSEFVEMFVGVGASRVRTLFESAKESAPAIIFIDEIDSIGKKRSSFRLGSSEESNTLNQILVEMDGFNTNENVVVFAATNRKELLDEALIRPGRFDRNIEINLPDIKGRKDIFNVHLKPLKTGMLDKEMIARRMASLTPGMSGAQIMSICNEAAILAVRNNHKYVKLIDFELAVEKVIAGIEKSEKEEDKHTKEIVAVHEAGHGTVSWFLKGAMPLLKVTIIPRSKGSLGFAQYLPFEGTLQVKENIEDQIVSVLAGRIAEEEFFGEVTTGAYDDLQKAKRMATELVTVYGMTDEIGFYSLENDYFNIPSISQKTQETIDELVENIIKKAATRSRELVRLHKDKIKKMSEELLMKKTLDLKDIERILGPRPYEPNENFKIYLETINDEQEIDNPFFEEERKNENNDDENEDEDDLDLFFDDEDDTIVRVDEKNK